jgi:GntR family transcriptional repressor for pyruvate dehydrogenase complex
VPFVQLAPIRRRKLYEEVADRLESLIHDGVYAPGDRLPSERDLMRQFGVGRPAVREALFALEKMGLVAVSSGERAQVTRPTPQIVVESLSGAARGLLAQPDGARDLQNARRFFEIGLARHAAAHASAEDIERLRQALEANKDSIDSARDFERTDVAFHYVLATIPRNPIFAAIHEAMVEWLTEQRTISLRHPGQNRIAYRAHEQIYQAVAARDPDRAEKVMGGHLDQVAALYWRVLDSSHERIRHHRGVPAQARNVREFPAAHRRKRQGVGPR